MIGKLTGILDTTSLNSILLDVQGVGYLVHCSPRTLARCGSKGEALSLYIDTNVREDAITLYGFIDEAEQQWFRLLHSVQGVGPKAAMAILGVCPPDKLAFAIAAGDKAAITQADGVGPKLATRILTELKDKVGKIDLAAKPKGAVISVAANESAGGVDQDAVSALINLGYQRADAYAAVMNVKQANDNHDVTLPEMIRLALKELSL
jgi:Holliday junction DNA helicase RuvA